MLLACSIMTADLFPATSLTTGLTSGLAMELNPLSSPSDVAHQLVTLDLAFRFI